MNSYKYKSFTEELRLFITLKINLISSNIYEYEKEMIENIYSSFHPYYLPIFSKFQR